jgi:hypothetical protein
MSLGIASVTPAQLRHTTDPEEPMNCNRMQKGPARNRRIERLVERRAKLKCPAHGEYQVSDKFKLAYISAYLRKRCRDAKWAGHSKQYGSFCLVCCPGEDSQ